MTHNGKQIDLNPGLSDTLKLSVALQLLNKRVHAMHKNFYQHQRDRYTLEEWIECYNTAIFLNEFVGYKFRGEFISDLALYTSELTIFYAQNETKF